MPSIKCRKCSGDGFVRHLIAGTYCDTTKSHASVVLAPVSIT